MTDSLSYSVGAGFVLHPDKSILTLTQQITYLGFISKPVKIEVALTAEHIAKILKATQSVLDSKLITLQQLAQLISRMVARFAAVPLGKMYHRRGDNLKNDVRKKTTSRIKRK